MMRSELKESLRQAYNGNASDRDKGDMHHWKLPVRESFLQRLLRENKASLLEIGAGPGKDSRFFADHGLDVTAADLSENMIELCRQKGLRAQVLDFFHLNELGRTFDAVWSMNCLLHVPKADLDTVLQQIDDVLNPSGLFHMGVYGGKDFEGIREEDICEPKRFFSFFTHENLKAVLEQRFEIVEFTVIDTEDENAFQSVVLRKRTRSQESDHEVV